MPEELLDDSIPVLIFDSAKQWERLRERDADDEMLRLYRLLRQPRTLDAPYEVEYLRDLGSISKNCWIEAFQRSKASNRATDVPN